MNPFVGAGRNRSALLIRLFSEVKALKRLTQMCPTKAPSERKQSGSCGVNSTIVSNTLMLGTVAWGHFYSNGLSHMIQARLRLAEPSSLDWITNVRPRLECWSGSADESPSFGSSIKLFVSTCHSALANTLSSMQELRVKSEKSLCVQL